MNLNLLLSLKEITTFYTSISTTLNDMAKEYDNVDNSNAGDLKKSIANNEEGVE